MNEGGKKDWRKERGRGGGVGDGGEKDRRKEGKEKGKK
jgi:hypothetical protein